MIGLDIFRSKDLGLLCRRQLGGQHIHLVLYLGNHSAMLFLGKISSPTYLGPEFFATILASAKANNFYLSQ